MKNLFCSYEVAKKLRELGFNKGCIAYYDKPNSLVMVEQDQFLIRETTYGPKADTNIFTAPLWPQVIEWIKDHSILIIESWGHCELYTSITTAGPDLVGGK